MCNEVKYKLHVIDITLLREYRNFGIGHYVLSNLVDTAMQAGIGMSLRVKQFNPAKNLYVRLGFMTVKAGARCALHGTRPPIFRPNHLATHIIHCKETHYDAKRNGTGHCGEYVCQSS